MRPFSRVPDSVLAAATCVAFDVDDTVTRDGKLEWEALAAMHALRREGLVLVAATGRPIGWADVWIRQWPIDAAVAENGAAFLRAVDRTIVERSLIGDVAGARARARALVAEHMPDVHLTTDDVARRYDVAWDIGETCTLPRERVDALDALLRDAGLHTTRSSIHLHASAAPHDKAQGIDAALVALGMGGAGLREHVLFVGDSPNDGPAFAYFTTSIGVANVRRTLPAKDERPKFVTEAEYGHGFAEVARAVVAARRAAREAEETPIDQKSPPD